MGLCQSNDERAEVDAIFDKIDQNLALLQLVNQRRRKSMERVESIDMAVLEHNKSAEPLVYEESDDNE
jgi:hypothetical protein